MQTALLFNQMRGSIDTYLDKYGQEDMPPPYQFFTLRNNAGVGNQHFIQKVFEGEFEVRGRLGILSLIDSSSLTFSSHRAHQKTI